VNETVTFEVGVTLPHLVKRISVFSEENGDSDKQEIRTDESKTEHNL
jgi:hypothetical protein